MLLERSRTRACSRSTPMSSSPRPTRCGGQSSSAMASRSRSTRGRRSAARRRPRRSAVGDESVALLRDPQGRPARRRARRPRRLDHGPPPRSVATRAETRSSNGTTDTSSGRRTRWPTGPTPTSGPTSANATFPSTPCTTGATRRSGAPIARSRERAAKVAGPERQDRVRAARVSDTAQRSTSRISTPSRPRRSTSCARSPPSSSAPCSCSPAARTRSCCCASPRRRSDPAASRSRSCTSTPATTSPR